MGDAHLQESAPHMVLHYRDDGPSGPCGQCTSITAPWSRLYVYDNENDAVAYMRFLKDRTEHAGRRRPRIEAFWYDEEYCPGPIVPEAER